MQVEYFIGIIFLIFLAAAGFVSVIGWMRESQKRETAEFDSRVKNAIIKSQQEEIRELKSWLSILEINAKKETEDK